MIDERCLNLGFGQGFLPLMLEEGAEVVAEQELPAAPEGEIDRSLESSIRCSLDDFAGCRSATILASDITRPSPTHLLLPPLVRGSRRWISPASRLSLAWERTGG